MRKCSPRYTRRTSALSTMSAGVPCASTVPSLMMGVVANAQGFAHVVVGNQHAYAPLLQKPMMRWISMTAIGSMPANGSSSRMKRGSVASARQFPPGGAHHPTRRGPVTSAGAPHAAHAAGHRAAAPPQFGQRTAWSSCCNSSTARMLSSTLSLRKMEASCGR